MNSALEKLEQSVSEMTALYAGQEGTNYCILYILCIFYIVFLNIYSYTSRLSTHHAFEITSKHHEQKNFRCFVCS